MTAQKFLLFAVVAVLLAVRVRLSYVRLVDLSEVVNKTVCPIVVDEDVNMDRVPERIKVFRCAREPNNRCKARKLPLYECCQHQSADHYMECVELRDTVKVYYKNTDTTNTHEVAVGCNCMIDYTTKVPEIPTNPLE